MPKFKSYSELRDFVKERDNNQCIICKKVGKLEVHHLDEEDTKRHDNDLYRKNNDLENLATLCISCHRKIHGRIRTDFPLNKRLFVVRERIYKLIWEDFKAEATVDELSQILRTSAPNFYRIIRINH